jgi:hypothetical protein
MMVVAHFVAKMKRIGHSNNRRLVTKRPQHLQTPHEECSNSKTPEACGVGEESRGQRFGKKAITESAKVRSSSVPDAKAIDITSPFIIIHEQGSSHNIVSEQLTWNLDIKQWDSHWQYMVVLVEE